MAARAHTSFIALALVAALSACGGGGGGDNDGTNGGGASAPVAGTDLTTLQSKLGITAGVDKTMRAANTEGTATSGTVRVDANPGRIQARVGEFSTGTIAEGNSVAATVMNGQVTRATIPGSVIYVPRTNADVHVGMVHRSSDDMGFAGVFGNETGASAIGARAAAGGKATYVGQAEYSQDIGIQTSAYRGAITATADFNTGGLDYGTGAMTRTSNTGGAASMRIDGSGVFNGRGGITGTYTTNPSSGTGSSGTTSGAFYGPTGQNIGLVFSGNGAAGAAILDESN